MTFAWLRPLGKWVLGAVVQELLGEHFGGAAPTPPPPKKPN